MKVTACSVVVVTLSLLLVCVAASIEDAAVGHVSYNGRVAFNASEPHHVQFDWSGIEIRASGVEGGSGQLSILLNEPQTPGNIYEVIIDGVVHPRLNTTATKKVYVLATNLKPGKHEVLVRKLTEAFFGVVSFMGFLQSDGQVIFNPPTSNVANRRIEAMGASFTCGYGVEGHHPCSFSPYTENYSKTYAAVIARTVGAQYHVECWSGKGVVRNYGWPNITAPEPFPVDFPRTLANVATSSWDFNAWQPHAVLLNIGSNDYSTKPTPPPELFESRAKVFMEGIRAKYAAMGDTLHIFYSCGPKPIMGGDVCEYIKKAVSQVRNAHYIDIQNVLDIPQDLGCDSHPNVVGQQKMANAILPVVREAMGWH